MVALEPNAHNEPNSGGARNSGGAPSIWSLESELRRTVLPRHTMANFEITLWITMGCK
jgi:hypothetical protein